jgi:catechol 2,3-dioxygenase-like lactoylglutathione lyase family enzyme
MNVEHVAVLVHDPKVVADWYVKNLGMKVVRQGGGPNYMTFIADTAGKTMFEIYKSDSVKLPDYKGQDPMVLHLAFTATDMEADRARLIKAGATPVGEVLHREDGDLLAMLRDPWGLPVQLVKRKKAML